MRLSFFDHKTCPWPIYNTEILPFCGCMVLAYGLVLQRWQGWTRLQVSSLFSAWWLGTTWLAQPTKVSQAQWHNIFCWKAMMIFHSILGKPVLHMLFSWGISAGPWTAAESKHNFCRPRSLNFVKIAAKRGNCGREWAARRIEFLSESGGLCTISVSHGGVWARHRKENVIESGIHLPNWEKTRFLLVMMKLPS